MNFNFKFDHVDNLEDENPDKAIANKIEFLFTNLVDLMRNPILFPNKHVNELMTLTWRLVGNKVIPCGMGETPEGTIAFLAAKPSDSNKDNFAMIICPPDWPKQVKADTFFCSGGMIYSASKARDFFNGQLFDGLAIHADVEKRAMAYEAEYYNTIISKGQKLNLNKYQEMVLEKYPNGAKDVEHLLYPRKKYLEAS